MNGKAEGKTIRGKINILYTLRGYSAYEVAVLNGFSGTEKEWLESLRATNDTNETIVSANADYAEVGEWSDGNPNGENRIGYFVSVDNSEPGKTMVKATSDSDVRGVTMAHPGFSANASKDKYDAEGNLLPQFDYVCFAGFSPVIDNGRCTVNGRCMPDDDGTAVPSPNNMGYQVIDRIDDTRVLVLVEPQADMMVRIKEDVIGLSGEVERISEQIGSGGGVGETDPTVPSWAKQPQKPTYTADEVGAISQDDLQSATDAALANAKASGEFDGERGPQGEKGKDGFDGKSAYQYAVEGGYTGTESEFTDLLSRIVTAEEYTQGIWKVKKYSNGECELWASVPATLTFAQWGNIYAAHNAFAAKSYPVKFASVPAVTATLAPISTAIYGYGLITGNTAGTVSHTPSFGVIRATAQSGSQSVLLYLYVKGTLSL